MPRRDGTGPMGMGAMTGRRRGACSGINAPAKPSRYGRGFGRGLGRGLARNQRLGFRRNPASEAAQTPDK
ncbi:MAG: DUF5320 domain-containing protein [Syntrophomonadaceae bacterium]